MFKHNKNQILNIKNQKSPSTENSSVVEETKLNGNSSEQPISAPAAPVTLAEVKELTEKNLKWSQILYEQNRRINRKLAWAATAEWTRLFLILVPLILAFIYLPPLLKDILSQYGNIFGLINPAANTVGVNANAVQGLLNNLNLNSQQIEQIKTLLGK